MYFGRKLLLFRQSNQQKMKLLIALTLLPFITLAQQEGYIPGYIISYTNDTTHGLIKLDDNFPYRKKGNIRFKKDDDTRKEAFSADELSEFNIGGVRYLSKFLKMKGGKYFFEVKTEGFLTYYFLDLVKFGRTADSPTRNPLASNSVAYAIFQKSDEYTQFEFRPGDPFFEFTDKMTAYLKDAPAICEKIKNRSYKNNERDIETIVQEYNNFISVSRSKP